MLHCAIGSIGKNSLLQVKSKQLTQWVPGTVGDRVMVAVPVVGLSRSMKGKGLLYDLKCMLWLQAESLTSTGICHRVLEKGRSPGDLKDREGYHASQILLYGTRRPLDNEESSLAQLSPPCTRMGAMVSKVHLRKGYKIRGLSCCP